MGAYVNFDLTQYKDFFQRVGNAAQGDFRKELETYLEGLGNEFLRVLQDEIIRREVIDTRLLLNSFHKGGAENIWEMDVGGLTLEVGTNVSYAKYVNDGHWTVGKGKSSRWVPGHWAGDRFIYSPGATTGMLLKQKWVAGRHFWESGLRIIEAIYPKLVEAKLQAWINSYFGL